MNLQNTAMKIAALAALKITPALVFILAETVAAPPPASGGETWGLTNSQDSAVAPYAFWTSVHVSTNSGVLTVSDITGHGFDMTNGLAQSRWPLLNGSSFQCNGTNTLGFFGYGGSGGVDGVAINNAAVNISPPFYWFTVMAITNQGIPTGQDAIASEYGFTESAFVIYAPSVYDTNQLNIQTWEFQGLTTFHNIVTNRFMLFELDFLGNASSTGYTNGVQGTVGDAGPNICSNLTIGSFWDMSHFSAQFSFVGLAVFTNMTPNARSNITYFTDNQFKLLHPVLTVASDNPDSGVAVTVTPNDNNGEGNGTTSFTRAYKDGTVVTLTAPATVDGNNFQKWQKDGADYSSSASTNVIMDADHHTMTAVYVSPGVTASYVTGGRAGTPRNSYSGFAGMQITVRANPVTVTALGRLYVPGNTGTHTVKLVNAVDGTDVPGGSVSVAMSGGIAGEFKYATLSSPVVLAAGTSYYVVSQETSGGDQYYGDDTTVTTTTVATEDSLVFGPGGGAWNAWGGAGQTYGPVDFQYVSSPTASYVTGKTLSTPRNDYNGFAGMKITVGANPVTVTALGRLYVPGNTGTHTVKLVNAVDGTDVPGGSVSVAMSGETAGDFTYAALSSPVVLAAGASYYVVSQETSGGDQYYGDATVTTTTVATEDSLVFGPGGVAWNAWGGAGQTYGPVDFQYSVTQASVLIQP